MKNFNKFLNLSLPHTHFWDAVDFLKNKLLCNLDSLMSPINNRIRNKPNHPKNNPKPHKAGYPSHTNPAANCVTHTNLHLVVRLDGDCDRLLLAGEDGEGGGRHFESSAAGAWNWGAWTYADLTHIFGTPWIFKKLHVVEKPLSLQPVRVPRPLCVTTTLPKGALNLRGVFIRCRECPFQFHNKLKRILGAFVLVKLLEHYRV